MPRLLATVASLCYVTRMALTCSLGFHRPDSDEVWNKGWYFTRCARCGSDLVRTGSGKWHVPRGRKVVWKSKTPRGRKPGDDGAEQEGGS